MELYTPLTDIQKAYEKTTNLFNSLKNKTPYLDKLCMDTRCILIKFTEKYGMLVKYYIDSLDYIYVYLYNYENDKTFYNNSIGYPNEKQFYTIEQLIFEFEIMNNIIIYRTENEQEIEEEIEEEED